LNMVWWTSRNQSLW